MSEPAPVRPEPIAQAIEIAVGDTVARGLRWGDSVNWILFVHDIGQDLDVWRDASRELIRHGYAGLLVDLPGHGLSDDPWELARLPEIVASVIALARRGGARRVFLVAAGEVAGRCLALPEPVIDALVALSPRMIAGAAGSPACPVLLVAGATDVTAMAEVRSVFAGRSGWTVWSTFPVPEQGTDLLQSAWASRVIEQIALFLRPYSV